MQPIEQQVLMSNRVQAALKARHLPPDLYKRLLDYFIFRYQKAQVADDRDLWTELPYDLQARQHTLHILFHFFNPCSGGHWPSLVNCMGLCEELGQSC